MTTLASGAMRQVSGAAAAGPTADHSVPSKEIYPRIAEMLQHSVDFWLKTHPDGEMPGTVEEEFYKAFGVAL